jgi:hypothetical protein
MLSPRRRQVIIGAIAATVAPPAFAALARRDETLVLSGRIVREGGAPIMGASVSSGDSQTFTDADGRFVLTTSTARKHVVSDSGREREVVLQNASLGMDGTWRATLGLTL